MPDFILSDEYFDRLYWPRIYLWWQETRGEDVLVSIDGFDVTDPYLVYDSLRVEQRADTFVSTCHFELVDEAGVLDLREKQEVVVEDGGHRYFAGVIANIDTRNMAGGTTTVIYTIECQDYNIMVEEVVIPILESFGGMLDSAIIDSLFDDYLPEINSHGPGDAPPGFVQSLHVFAEIEFEAITLREALDRIASEVESVALEGYWYIDFYKRLHYFNVEDNAPAWYLSDTPDNVNSFSYFNEVRRTRQGAALTNRILVVGAEMALYVQDYDSNDYYGKWYEGVVRDNTLLTVDEIMQHGYSLLTKWAYPDESFEFSIRKTDLRAGMNVRFENTLFGTKTRRNWIKNPSFELNIADNWTLVAGGGPGAVRICIPPPSDAAVGSCSCELTAGNAADSEMQSNTVTVQPTETVTVQARIYRAADTACEVVLRDVTNNVDRNSISPYRPDHLDTWEVLTCAWTNPLGVPVDIEIRIRNTEADNASVIQIDACMAEIDKGPHPLEYVDGSLAYCYWDDPLNPHNSTSSRPPVYMIRQLTVTWPQNTPTFALTLGGTVTGTALIKSRLAADSRRRSVGPVVPSQLPLCSRGWSHDLDFAVQDQDTIEWGAGDIITAAGQTFAIVAGDTGDMAANTAYYIYFDLDTAVDALQVTDLGPPAGANMILVAYAMWDGAEDSPMFISFGGGGDSGIPMLIAARNLVADSVTANEIHGNTLSVIAANMGTLTAGIIQSDVAGNDRIVIDCAVGLTGYSAADVIQFRLDITDGKAYFGAGACILDEDGVTIIGIADADQIMLRHRYDDAGILRTIGSSYTRYNTAGAGQGIFGHQASRFVGSPWGEALHIISAVDVVAGTDVRLTISSAGSVGITGCTDFNVHDGDRHILRAINGDVQIQLGDALGVKEFVVRDSALVDKLAVDSDGKLVIGSTISTGWGTTWDLQNAFVRADRPADRLVYVVIGGANYSLLAAVGHV